MRVAVVVLAALAAWAHAEPVTEDASLRSPLYGKRIPIDSEKLWGENGGVGAKRSLGVAEAPAGWTHGEVKPGSGEFKPASSQGNHHNHGSHHQGHGHHHHHEHECIHDHIMGALGWDELHRNNVAPQNYKQPAAAESVQGRRAQTASEFQSIRIKFDFKRLDNSDSDATGEALACYTSGQQYLPTLATSSSQRSLCTEDDILTPEKKEFLKNSILEEARIWFETTLKVRPVDGNLVLSNPLSDDYACSVTNDGDNYHYSFVCCNREMRAKHYSDMTTGVPSADFVIYVTARPTGGSTIAWALTCQNDQIARPIAGHANFAPARISTDPAERAVQLSTAIHELYHALGFSGSKFYEFRRPGTTDRATYRDVVKSYEEMGKYLSKLITPNVQEQCKNHFDCHDWDTAGAELEDFGGSGTAGSHWEKRLFANEFMTGTADPNSVYSAISMAALADSGWYEVDYTLAERLPWGRAQGCPFVQQTCGQGWNERYFCSEPGREGCTVDMRYKARCSAQTTAFTLPAQHQYFPDNPQKGGSNSYADYCPMYTRLSSGDCQSDGRGYWFYGEEYGSTSACFAGTYIRSSVADPSGPTHHSGCLQADCDFTNRIVVTLNGGSSRTVEVTCPISGGSVNLATVPGNQDFVGTLECPPASALCTGDPCDRNDCSGHGTCSSDAGGECTCNAGWFGDDAFHCDKKSCPVGPNNQPCSGNADCDTSRGVCVNADNGLDGCNTGFRHPDAPAAADCSQPGCPQAFGAECAGVGACTAVTNTTSECHCPSDRFGLACELQECPGSPRCSGTFQGFCDSGSGLCECALSADNSGNVVYFSGPDCSQSNVGEPEPIQLHYFGEPIPSSRRLAGNDSTSDGDASDGGEEELGDFWTGVLPDRAYTYFQLEVRSVSRPIHLDLTLSTASTEGLARPLLAAAYRQTGSGEPLPSLRGEKHSWKSVLVNSDGSQQRLVLSSGGGGTAAFTQQGTVAVALANPLQNRTVEARLKLSQDACANMDCANGAPCSAGRCDCSAVLRWSGERCDIPDCPGTPDCSGRGTCTVPEYGDATTVLPYCECLGIFDGVSCQEYNVPEGTGVIGGETGDGEDSWVPLPLTSMRSNPDYVPPTYSENGTMTSPGSGSPTIAVESGSYVVFNATSTLEVGEGVDRVVVDTSGLVALTASGNRSFEDGKPFSVFVRMEALNLDEVSEANQQLMSNAENDEARQDLQELVELGDAPPARLAVEAASDLNANPDPILIVGLDGSPSLTANDGFDRRAWSGQKQVHELVTRVPAGSLFFAQPRNGRYATKRLEYTIHVEVAQGSCPPGLNDCSGHGVGECIDTCVCQPGWEGIRCDVRAPTLESGSVAAVSGLEAGEWAYFVHEVPSGVTEVRLAMAKTQATQASSSATASTASTAETDSSSTATLSAAPLLVVAWEATRSSTSLDKLTGSGAMFDFDGFTAPANGTQELVISRSVPASQRFLIMGIQNQVHARADAHVALTVFDSVVPSEFACAHSSENEEGELEASPCCNNRGALVPVSGQDTCRCQSGWSSSTRCAAPRFASASSVVVAAQGIDFMCSLCSQEQVMLQDDMSFFRVPQPLQKGTGLRLDVSPSANGSLAQASADASPSGLSGILSMLGFTARHGDTGGDGSYSMPSILRPSNHWASFLSPAKRRSGPRRSSSHPGQRAAAQYDHTVVSVPSTLWTPLSEAESELHRRRRRTAATHGRRSQEIDLGGGGDGGGDATVATRGNPSLLVSTRLPRTITDFVHISSSDNANETIVLSGASPTGAYFFAVYANNDGAFKMEAEREALSSQPPKEEYLAAEVANWLFKTQSGQVVFVILMVVVVIMIGGCAIAFCAPGFVEDITAKLHADSELTKEALKRQWAQSSRRINLGNSGGDGRAEQANQKWGALRRIGSSMRNIGGLSGASNARSPANSSPAASTNPKRGLVSAMVQASASSRRLGVNPVGPGAAAAAAHQGGDPGGLESARRELQEAAAAAQRAGVSAEQLQLVMGSDYMGDLSSQPAGRSAAQPQHRHAQSHVGYQQRRQSRRPPTLHEQQSARMGHGATSSYPAAYGAGQEQVMWSGQ